jgi:signal transduction histidine kinase
VVTVHDDGTGFDTRTLPSDRGFAQSIEARLHEVGGTATVRSMNGHGTEVTLWVP